MKYGFLIFLFLFVFVFGGGYLVSKYQELQDENQALKQEIVRLNQEKQELLQQLEEQQNITTDITSQRDELLQKAQAVETALSQMTQERNNLAAQLADLRSQIDQLNQVLAAAQEREQELIAKLEAAINPPAVEQPNSGGIDMITSTIVEMTGHLDDQTISDAILVFASLIFTIGTAKLGKIKLRALRLIDQQTRAYYHDICKRQRRRM